MIAQSILNIESGGRTRLSGVIEALCILCFVVFASGLIGLIPMAALVGAMFVVVYKTFAWRTLVTAVTVLTNLATAVLIGVIVSALKFAWDAGTRLYVRRYPEGEQAVYELHGPLFFSSPPGLAAWFDPANDPPETIIDFQFSRLHDD